MSVDVLAALLLGSSRLLGGREPALRLAAQLAGGGGLLLLRSLRSFRRQARHRAEPLTVVH